jgi:hemoglobin
MPADIDQNPETRTLFDELGGEPVLREIIRRFVAKVTGDTMIGFLFARVDRSRLEQKEYEFAAQHLGAGVAYTGRPLDVAHRAHSIFGGQFMRRLQLLKDTLAELGVSERVREHWVRHTLELMPLITHDLKGSCEPETTERTS